MSVSVPLNTIVLSAVPTPVANVSPVVPASVSVPLVTDRITSSWPPPASASVITT